MKASDSSPDLFLTALTHSSWVHEHGGQSYERLEFLGDAVLDLCITELLLAELPDAAEGRLNDVRQRLVNAATLAELSRELGLGEAMRVAEKQAHVRSQEKPLSDVWEAMLGALYLSHGIAPCREVVKATVLPRMHRAGPAKTAKARLQEWSQKRHGGAVPRYEELGRSGPDNAPEYHVAVHVGGRRVGDGRGTSKKAAQQAAATAALARLESDR